MTLPCSLWLSGTLFDNLWQCVAISDYATKFCRTTCDNLWTLVVFCDIYDNVVSYGTLCDLAWQSKTDCDLFVTDCDILWPFVIDLWPIVTVYDRFVIDLWPFVTDCDILWPFAIVPPLNYWLWQITPARSDLWRAREMVALHETQRQRGKRGK